MIHGGPITCPLLTLTALAGDRRGRNHSQRLVGTATVGDLANPPVATAWSAMHRAGLFQRLRTTSGCGCEGHSPCPPKCTGNGSNSLRRSEVQQPRAGQRPGSGRLFRRATQPFDIDGDGRGPAWTVPTSCWWAATTGPASSRPQGRFIATLAGASPQAYPRDKILSPVGGLYGQYGIWMTSSCGRTRLCTSRTCSSSRRSRRGELVVEYTLANDRQTAAVDQLRATPKTRGATCSNSLQPVWKYRP
jgi:hypothetical protein